MHPEHESYKMMGGLLGLFVGWWIFVDMNIVASILGAVRDQDASYPMLQVLCIVSLHIGMFVLLAQRNIHFRIPFCISVFFWIWADAPYPDFMTLAGICVTPALSIMYIFCSIRVDVYCGVWKAR